MGRPGTAEISLLLVGHPTADEVSLETQLLSLEMPSGQGRIWVQVVDAMSMSRISDWYDLP